MEKCKTVPFRNVTLGKGFWLDRYNLNKNVSLGCVKKVFEETGRFDALRFNYLKTGRAPHYYFDSDVAKWIEAVSYIMEHDRESMRENETLIDELVDCMEKAQRDDGYLNSATQQLNPELKFKDRDRHELYCAGHLIEGAVAYYQATGKDKFLKVVERYCDCIYDYFVKEHKADFYTPGHEEIELALFKLYRLTGKEKYRKTAEFFLENRGKHDEKNMIGNAVQAQDDADMYNLKQAGGHAVRALYLYSGLADYAAVNDDEKLYGVLDGLFEDITTRKMYITGGVGSSPRGECFTVPFDLPNPTAYAESCTAVAFILFALRMRRLKTDAKFGNLIERIMYNMLLSPTSLDGKRFFYENPHEISLEDRNREISLNPASREHFPITQRVESFTCSCCPPNINRFFGEFADVIAVEQDCLYIEQYVSSIVNTAFGTVTIDETYALDGKATISSADFKGDRIVFRKPEWCDEIDAEKNGKAIIINEKDGYFEIPAESRFEISLDFKIRPKFMAANPLVGADVGKVALTYGPTVYCLEGKDNGERLKRISLNPAAAVCVDKQKDFHGFYSLYADGQIDKAQDKLYFSAENCGKEKKRLKFIPFFAQANRGESDMIIWIRAET